MIIKFVYIILLFILIKYGAANFIWKPFPQYIHIIDLKEPDPSSICWEQLNQKWILFIGDSSSRMMLEALNLLMTRYGFNVTELKHKYYSAHSDYDIIIENRKWNIGFSLRFAGQPSNVKEKVIKTFTDSTTISLILVNRTKVQIQSNFTEYLKNTNKSNPDIIIASIGGWYHNYGMESMLLSDIANISSFAAQNRNIRFIWRSAHAPGKILTIANGN